MLDWANNDSQIERLLRQVIGATIQQDVGSGKAFVLTNEAAGNGKSTFLNLVVSFLGLPNIATVSLQAMAKDSHQAAALVGKFANIVDDMSGDFVGDISTFKTLCTGGYAVINPKHVKPYTVRLTATCILCCNKIPRIGDTTNGLNDRLVIVPFFSSLSR